VRIRIDSPSARFGIIVVGFLVVVPFSYYSARAYRARRNARVPDVSHLQSAVDLEPGDAESHALLGLAQLQALQNAALAQKSFQTATALNPHDGRYWLYLATADSFLNDSAGQKRALERAIEVEPTSPSISWVAANFLLTNGETERALRLLRVVLESPSSDANQVYSISWRASGKNTGLLLRELVPPNLDGSTAFLRWLTARGETQAAEQVWRRAQDSDQRMDSRSLPYVDLLLAGNHVVEAKEAWDAIASGVPSMARAKQRDNLVFNGNFDEEPLNSGFDWHIAPGAHVTVLLDTATAHVTSRSLSLNFNGSAAGDLNLYQLIAVQPNTQYAFSAYQKTEELSSSSEPQIRISDMASNAELLSIKAPLGSSSWRQIQGEFRTGNETRLIKLALEQTPPRVVRGTVWLAEVVLQQRRGN